MKDDTGEPVKHDWERSVVVDVKYELKPSPRQPLIIDIYGYNLFGLGQTEKLVLDNGVVLTGRTEGGSGEMNTGEIKRMRMFDVEESGIELHPMEAGGASPEIDSAVFGVLSSNPLDSCGHGFSSPSRPFTYTRNPDHLKRWAGEALQLHHNGLEITFVKTSNYWQKLVDRQALYHEAIVGVRKDGGGVLAWEELHGVTYLLSNFLGWLSHCAAPVFHVKGYRHGKLVYRGYDLHPHATVQRDIFSWLPRHIEDENGKSRRCGGLVQDLLDGFAKAWDKNERDKGIFHIALQLLRGQEKGAPRSQPSIGYLRDTFAACGILEHMLTGESGSSGRQAQIARCLGEINVEDRLPGIDEKGLGDAIQHSPKLWWAARQERVLEDERRRGTLSRPLANIENWLLHLEDTRNAEMLLGLGRSVQAYLVEVSMWLADLMAMKVVGYRGWYFNRLTRQSEKVPWAI